MPYRVWNRRCCGPETVTVTSPRCPNCDRPGSFAGWRLAMPECKELYTRTFGLEPTGAHRPLADRLLFGLRSMCHLCEGRGIVGDGFDWRECLVCEGGGGAWTAPETSLRAAYARLLEAFPAAAVPGGNLPFVGPPAPRKRRRPTSGSKSGRGRQRVRPSDEDQLTDVQRAFIRAERTLGVNWKLKGRGHCERTTLKSWHSRAVAPVTNCWEMVHLPGQCSSRRVFPWEIVVEAARILGVDVFDLVG